jgi:archaellum component FlaD/FlaE
MQRKNVFLNDKQISFLLENKELNISDHIRRALDEYIERLKSERATSSASKIINK